MTIADISLQSNSASQFVGHLLTSIFGISELTKNTVTGKISNRNVNKDNIEVGKLDPVKLEAARGKFLFHIFYLYYSKLCSIKI